MIKHRRKKYTDYGLVGKIFNKFWGAFNDKKIIKFTRKCNYCKVQIARWVNRLEDDLCCDDCVPRGCSCRLFLKNRKARIFKVDNYDYKKDSKGRALPCENWEKL